LQKMKNYKRKIEVIKGSIVIPLLLGIGVVALVLGILVIGGKRDEQGNFIFPFGRQKGTDSWWMPADQEGVAITPLPNQNIVISKFFLQIASPIDGATVSQNKITVSGKTVPGAEISVNEKELAADKNGNFSTSVLLEEGENFIFVTAGNEDGFEEKEIVVNYEK